MSTFLPRALGVATVVYSVAIIARPKLMAGPTSLTDATGEVPTGTAILVRGVGMRDLAIGTVMALAPAGPALKLAVAARVLSDAGDTLFFGTQLPDRAAAKKASAVSGGWALLNLAGLRWAG